MTYKKTYKKFIVLVFSIMILILISSSVDAITWENDLEPYLIYGSHYNSNFDDVANTLTTTCASATCPSNTTDKEGTANHALSFTGGDQILTANDAKLDVFNSDNTVMY